MYEYKLSANERGYKQAGKKLRPRDAYDAMERDHLRLHSLRALRRTRMAECAAMRHQFDDAPLAHQNKFDRAMAGLKPWQQRKVYELLDSPSRAPAMPRRMRRAYDAAIEAEQIERAMQWDANTLANAY